MTCQRYIGLAGPWAAALACICVMLSHASAAPAPIAPGAVLAHVKQTVDWYHEARDAARLPELSPDILAPDRFQQAALSVVRQAFAFGNAAVTLIASSSAGGAGAAGAVSTGASHPATALDQAVARINDRMASLQSQLAQIDSQLTRSAGRARTALQAQRNDVDAALALEREVQSTVEELQRFQTSTLVSETRGNQGLLGQIQDLERSVPEARPPGSGSGQPAAAAASTASNAAAKSTATATPAAIFRPESAGIFALAGRWFALERARHELNTLSSATDELTEELGTLRKPLIGQARSLIAADTSSLETQNAAQLDAARRALEDAADRFKQLATLLVPLGEQDFVLDDARGAIREWRDSVDSSLGSVERYLLLRAGGLAALIALVLVVSEIWKRATLRYFHDARRRSQFQTLRRVAVGIALVLVVTFGLVSQLGSLATYAGFLTAGLAVALQTVILSIVAYFFLIGRYGVRVGDRITLAGVTGRVLDIGLIRLYLMELGGNDLHSTGRVVVMSNSVLFQPQALFKQIPGADFLWHVVAVTLEPSVDVQAVQQRLQATADGVYEHYRDAMEAQHAAVQQFVEFETSMPRPEVRVGFAEKGLEFEVRYPVQGARAVTIDQQMLSAVREMLAKDPKLPVAASGEPSLKRIED